MTDSEEGTIAMSGDSAGQDETTASRALQVAGGFFSTPGGGLFLIGILSVVLMVPMIWLTMLADERAERAADVASRIALGWGGAQKINGPYIVVPKLRPLPTGSDASPVILMPDTLEAKAALGVESRTLSIYSTPVYKSQIRLEGRFSPSTLLELQTVSEPLDWARSRLVLGISDTKGIRSDTSVTVGGGAPKPFEPGLGDALKPVPDENDNGSGISVPIDLQSLRNGFAYGVTLELNGSGRFSVAPAGQTTALSVHGDWPHPGFEGFTLPERQSVSESGFTADWKIPYLARGIGKMHQSTALPLRDSMMSVGLVEPVGFYQEITRTLKYAFGFFVVTFFSVFLLAIRARQRVYAVQYVLTGSAIGVFYLLLLGLGEHLGFGLAYLIGSAATTALIGLYGATLVGRRRYGMVLAAVLAVSYGLLYLLMKEEDFALLAGSIIAFITVAVTMFSTRNIDWAARR